MLFPNVAPDTRVWVYTSTHLIPRLAQRALLDGLDAFFAHWTSHGRPVAGQAVIVEGRFVAVAATLDGLISGCGIDKLDHAVRDLAARLGLAFTSSLDVAYRDAEGRVEVVPRGTFRKYAREGQVGPQTPVFNTGVASVAEFAEFEVPANKSWHAALFSPALHP